MTIDEAIKLADHHNTVEVQKAGHIYARGIIYFPQWKTAEDYLRHDWVQDSKQPRKFDDIKTQHKPN